MSNGKKLLLAVGASLFFFAFGVLLLFFAYKLLNSPTWMLSAITWMLIWPNLLISKAGIPYPGRMLSLAVGPITNVTILSGLFYVVISLFRRTPPTTTTPPLPPRFD